jgi:hypothetical protein
MGRRLSGGAAAPRVVRSRFLLVCGRMKRKSVKMSMGQEIFGLGVLGWNGR